MSLAKAGYKRVPREVLKADRTYYVRTDGSDANDGLANTVGRAFLTIAKAIAVVAALDLSIYNVTIQLQDATWNTDVAVNAPWVGSGTVTLQGNTGTPANVVINGTSRSISVSGSGAKLTIAGMTITTGSLGLVAENGGAITLGSGIVFGAAGAGAGYHMVASGAGAIINALNTSYSIIGAAARHVSASPSGYINLFNTAITLVGTLNFAGAFAYADRQGFINANAATFTGGTITGSRYSVATSGLIVTGVASETFFPGNAAGTRASGGIYIGLIGGTRELLTANRTYYVRADGSNSNDGLSNTAGGAFLTLQKAWDVVASLDLSIYAVTIKVADGTYAAGVNMAAMPVGGSGIVWEGNVTSPGNVHVSLAGTCFAILAPLPCAMTIKGFKTTFSSTGGSAVRHSGSGQVTVQNMELAGGSTGGFTGAYRADTPSAYLIVGTGQLISGGMSCFAQAIYGGVVQFFGITVTLTGTPAFSWITIGSQNQGYVEVVGVTFSGAATGVRYGASTGGGINTNGAGASFIPGSSAGSATSPGWYI